MNPICQSIPSKNFPNAKLCEWLSQKTDFVPHEKISPRELSAAATQILEQEWQKIFSKDHYLLGEVHQPLAEGLYNRFHFLPPWLPKPVAAMTQQEKNIFQNFLVSLQTRNAQQTINESVRFDSDRAVVEDSFFGILEAGVASCVGISDLFYFAKKIVGGKNTSFIDVYADAWDNPYFHVATRGDEGPYDPSYAVPLASTYRWRDLEPMDQWAISLMNTGISKRERELIDLSHYLIEYGFRAYELAPDDHLVQQNLKDFIRHSRQ